MHRSFKFLLSPTAGQRRDLGRLLAVQAEVYNASLEERRGAWRKDRRRVTKFEQYGQIAELRVVRPDVAEFGVCVTRGTLTRVDEAFNGFFRRVRGGTRAGYPRFRSTARFDSVTYPDMSGWKLDMDARRFRIQGVGHVKVRVHQAVRGVPKTAHVRREGKRWWAVIVCDNVPPRPLPPTGRNVGVDVGVAVLAATSDGQLVVNPRSAAKMADRVTAARQQVARRTKGSGRRRKAVARLAELKRTEANIRRNAAHQLSRMLVNSYDVICVEGLTIPNMVRSAAGTVECPGVNVAAKAGLNRSILDAGWGQVLCDLTYKAAEAGRELIVVDPRHTSQRCSQCGHTEAANRTSQAEFACRRCGHHANADVNAAINILRAGLAQRNKREVTEPTRPTARTVP